MCTFCWSPVLGVEGDFNPDHLFDRCAGCGSEETALMIIEKEAAEEKRHAKYALYCYTCGMREFGRRMESVNITGWLCLCLAGANRRTDSVLPEENVCASKSTGI